jgi:hypothetical protein
MKRQMIRFLLLLFGILAMGRSSDAQTPGKIQNITIQAIGDEVVITYDLTDTKKQNWFDVKFWINTLDGNKIFPRTVSGDIGRPVKAGKQKEIHWEINKDQVYIDEDIFVEITAEPVEYIVPVSRGAALGLSAVVPGLGISKLNNSGAYWLLAVGFYGTGAASAYYYIKYNDTYQKYLEMTDIEKRDKLYSQAQNEQVIAQVLMYSAAAIYVTNIIWTLAQRNKTKPKETRITWGGALDPVSRTPVFSLRYAF